MNCIDYIRRMPDSLSKEIRRNELYAGKPYEGRSLTDILTLPHLLKTTYDSLYALEKRTLEVVIRHMGYELFDAPRLEKAALPTMSGAELKIGLIRLRQKGIVFTLRKAWGEQMFIVPYDTFPIWQQMVMPDLAKLADEGAKVKDENAVEIHRNAKRGLAYDLFHMLSFIAKHELPLTQKGTIHKRHLQRLLEEIELDGEDLSGMQLSYAMQTEYTPQAAVVLDIALRLGLIEQSVHKIALSSAGLAGWLQNVPERQQALLYHLWLRLHTPQPVWMQHVATAMQTLPTGRWFETMPLVESVRAHQVHIEVDNELALTQLAEQWIVPLAAGGWLEMGETSQGRQAFRWISDISAPSRMGHASELARETSFYIQPDYEIIVPPQVSFDVRWELECMADHIRTDRVSHYKITKESILRACENDRSVNDIIGFMNNHAKYGIPDNVRQSMEQWATQHGMVHFEEVTLLRCKDERIAAEVAVNPQCTPYIAAAVGKQDFIVAREQINEFMRILDKCGYTPKKQIAVSGEKNKLSFPKFTSAATDDHQPISNHDERDIHADGLVYVKFAAHFYEMEPTIPQPEQMYPNLQQVPPMWLKEFRAYHVSTRRELIERAIEWKTYLKLRKDGADINFMPAFVKPGRDTWYVTGTDDSDNRKPVELSPLEWQEMQLILPGINA
jgi:hypothetical protein